MRRAGVAGLPLILRPRELLSTSAAAPKIFRSGTNLAALISPPGLRVGLRSHLPSCSCGRRRFLSAPLQSRSQAPDLKAAPTGASRKASQAPKPQRAVTRGRGGAGSDCPTKPRKSPGSNELAKAGFSTSLMRAPGRRWIGCDPPQSAPVPDPWCEAGVVLATSNPK